MSPAALTGEDLRRLLGVRFTHEQIDAITAPMAPSVVIAGAGSGKTTVMSARVVWLVGSGFVAPDQILGLTFTNKAAAELAARVRRALQQLAAAGVQVPEGAPLINTYHSYAAGLLREYGLHAGFEPGATLLAEAARYQLAERVVRRAAGPFEHLRGRIGDLARSVVSLDSELNEHLVDACQVHRHAKHLLDELTAVRREKGTLTAKPAVAESTAKARGELVELVEEFRREKRRLGVVDFGDQMAGAALLAKQHPVVVTAERERFRAVLLDEYQDTSITQKRLLLSLFGTGHPVTAVGDPFQAIYGWRGASVRNIMEYSEEFSTDGARTPVHSLAQNNRSGERILELANEIARPLRAIHPDVSQLAARADLEGEGAVSVSLHSTFADEVTALAADIKARVEAGEAPGSIAVLCRAATEFGTFHRALTEHGLPVEVVGLTGLLELPEIADLVATLQVIDDPGANPALVRLLAGSRWRIGPRDLALLGARARALAGSHTDVGGSDLSSTLRAAVAGIDPVEMVSLADAIHDVGDAPFSAAARDRFHRFDQELTRLRRHRSDPLPDLVRLVLDVTGLAVEAEVNRLSATAHGPDHLAAFVSTAAAFTDLDGSATLGSFLAFLAASVEYDGGLDSTKPSGADTVKVMTIHKAKGLEWPSVYLPNLSAGVFPSGRGRSLWITAPSVLPYELRGDAGDFPTVNDWAGNGGCDRFREAMTERDAIEERRLAYVAVTRAARHIHLSGHWWGPSQKTRRGPSSYLQSAHAFCLGGGDVRHWEPEPAEGAVNPVLVDAVTAPWPPRLSPEAAAARQAGVDLVRQATTQLAAVGSSPIDPSLGAVAARQVAEWDEDLTALLAEAATLADPHRAVQLPAPMSASSLVRLAHDPQGLARDLARPMPRPPAPAAERGTTFHQWVEARFGQEPLIDLDALSESPPHPETDELRKLQEAFLAGPFAERAPVAVEAPFHVVLGGQVISGRIDAVYAGAEGSRQAFEVVDWKTGRRPADPLQLAIYRLAWAELNDLAIDEVGAAFYYVAAGVIESPTDLPGRAELEQIVQGDGAYAR